MQSSDHIHCDEPPDGSIRQKEANIAIANAPVDDGIEALDTVIRLIRENTEPSGWAEEHPQTVEKSISPGEDLHT